MPLEKYQAKRHFDKTPEPSGKAVKGKGPLRFVIQRHEASRLHYDFRLEMDGVLKSWAVPKGPSLDPHERRLAMMVEDHPLDYRSFEGIIPEGNYGAGTVMVWDEGTYAPWAEVKKGQWQEVTQRAKAEKILKQMLKDGHLTFMLDGHKLKGEFALIKMKEADDNAWLLIKKGDEFANPKRDVTTADRSVVSGRSMDQIAKAGDKQWTNQELDLSGAPKTPMPHNLKPMLASLTDAAFDRSGWLFEIKWDGYRAVAEVDKKVIKLYSRNQQPFEQKFAPVAEALKLVEHQAVLDGEVVAVDGEGRSRFQLLQNYQKTGEGTLVYYVFDILYLDGHDLTKLPLIRRKQILQQILPVSDVVKFSDHVEQKGKDFFEAAKSQKLEGIMAKDSQGQYQLGKRSQSWLKIKTHQRQEVVVGGYTEPRGSRKGVGSLLLGVYEAGKLMYVGNSGGAFGGLSPEELLKLLKPLEVAKSPFATAPPKQATAVHWVKPRLVSEVEFSEWTGDGHMRHPNVIGWRTDKDPKTVAKEVPESPPAESKPAADTQITVDGHKLKLTNLDKVYWPDDGYTKGDLIAYYRSMAALMLPYLKDRPENLNRHPGGINGPSFYQKDQRDKLPSWIKTTKIYSESNQAEINYLVCSNAATLIYMANLGCIEINPWNSRVKQLDNPDYLVIDLDPEDIGFDAVIQTARVVHEVLEEAGAAGYPKTSGATGLHIYVPLGAKYDYEQAKQFAHLVAVLVNQRLPNITSVERSPAKRQGKIYLDYLQNRHGQTLATAYAVRPQPGATVSTPLAWDEVKPGLSPSDFTVKNIAARVEQVGDLWKPVIGRGIDLQKCLKRLGG